MELQIEYDQEQLSYLILVSLVTRHNRSRNDDGNDDEDDDDADDTDADNNECHVWMFDASYLDI